MILAEDIDRLDAFRARVEELMADGCWHSAFEIRAVGGSEGLRRFREVREGRSWEKRCLGRGLWEYRIR